MTIPIYQTDSELFVLDSRVSDLGVDGSGTGWIELEATVLHPQGGGQPSDQGRISGNRVLSVRRDGDGRILHFVDSLDQISKGGIVTVEVAQESRKLNSEHHTFGHLLAEVVEDRYSKLSATSGHHWPGEARVVFEGECADLPELERFCSEVTQMRIHRNESVVVKNGPKREIKIGSGPPQACGGTHVSSLGSLAGYRITKVKRKSGTIRISYGN